MPDVSAYDRALGFLSRREYAERELFEKLVKCELDRDVIRETLDRLKSENYLSDARYIEMIVRSKSNALYGPAYIRQYVARYAIDDLLLAEYLSDDYDAWSDSLEQLLDKQIRTRKIRSDAFSDQQKWLQCAARRGFSVSWARKIWDKKILETEFAE